MDLPRYPVDTRTCSCRRAGDELRIDPQANGPPCRPYRGSMFISPVSLLSIVHLDWKCNRFIISNKPNANMANCTWYCQHGKAARSETAELLLLLQGAYLLPW